MHRLSYTQAGSLTFYSVAHSENHKSHWESRSLLARIFHFFPFIFISVVWSNGQYSFVTRRVCVSFFSLPPISAHIHMTRYNFLLHSTNLCRTALKCNCTLSRAFLFAIHWHRSVIGRNKMMSTLDAFIENILQVVIGVAVYFTSICSNKCVYSQNCVKYTNKRLHNWRPTRINMK